MTSTTPPRRLIGEAIGGALTMLAGYAMTTGDVCPTDPPATTQAHATQETASGARTDEDIVDETDWSFLSGSP